jgi:hypothetical protein
MSANMDLLNALAAQLGREKVVAMCEAFLSSGADKPAAKQVKKVKKAAPASDTEEDKDKPKRQLPLKLVQWQSFVRYCKEKFPERFESVKGAPAMQQLCKTLKEEEGVWTDFESSWVAPEPALEPAHNTGPAPAPAAEGEDTEDEEEKPKKKRQWSEEAKASAAAKRAAKKALKGSDSESVASAGKEKEE